MTTVILPRDDTVTTMSEVATADGLTMGHLNALLDGRILALRIPDYFPDDLATRVSRRLIDNPRYGAYENAPDIARVGRAFYETVGDLALRERYFAEAQSSLQNLRRTCFPNPSPVDLFRLDLQEIWPAGATLENLDGRPFFVGLTRVFLEGSPGALPHQDVLAWDAPDSPRAHELRVQLAANIYLQPSLEGGELEIWREFYTIEEHQAALLPGSYGLDRAALPASAVTLAPSAGELILFDSRRVHAVRPSKRGDRIAMAAFIGYRGPAAPLTYWS